MEPKRTPFWAILLCVLAVLGVAVAVLACMPSWNAVADESALEAIFAFFQTKTA